MYNNKWYDAFIAELYNLYPVRNKLVEALMDLLSIERESAYRRLRKDIKFSIDEVARIAFAWNISLDAILNIKTSEIPFKLQLRNYINPSKEQIKQMQSTIQTIEQVCTFSDSEFMEVSNRLPRSLATGFPWINKIYLQEWMYHFCNHKVLPLSQIDLTGELVQLSTALYAAQRKIKQTHFVWDKKMFDFLVDEIKFAHSIYLLSDEDKKAVKKELFDFLDYMQKVTIDGCWPETGNEVNIYISQPHVDTNYNYYAYGGKVRLCNVLAFDKNEIYTTAPKIMDNFKRWMLQNTKSSVLISRASEKIRIDYFKEQRRIVESL